MIKPNNPSKPELSSVNTKHIYTTNSTTNVVMICKSRNKIFNILIIVIIKTLIYVFIFNHFPSQIYATIFLCQNFRNPFACKTFSHSCKKNSDIFSEKDNLHIICFLKPINRFRLRKKTKKYEFK